MPFKLNPFTGELDWVIGPGTDTAVIQVDTDSGSAVPNDAGVITLAGGTGIDTSGSVNTVTINFDITEVPTIANTYNADSGSAVPSSNILEILGQTVANATNAAPFFTIGSGNTLTGQIQVSTAIASAPGDKNDAGICSFDSSVFTVDSDGFVSLASGPETSVDTNIGDDGINVSPDANGKFSWIGVTVANATEIKPVYFKDSSTPNALDLEVQVSAAITGAPGDKNDAGLASFDDTIFTVDSNGYVSLATTGIAQTITGDSGGALSPSSNNWNILGGPGVTTTGSGSTLTINSVVYSDESGSTSVVSDSGSFATNAVTLTLPASPNDGERVELIATNGVLTVQAAGTQVIHIAGDSSSAGGTLTGTATGDSISLIYQASTDDWWSLGSPAGVWVAA